MTQGRLDPLQERVLHVLAGACPGWRLTGGAALAGFHLGHRTTRDLDLLWGGCKRLDRIPEEVRAALAAEQLSVATVQSAPSFHRMRVTDGHLVTVLDLVAEPGAPMIPAGVGFVRAQVSFLPGLSGLFGGRGEEFDFSAGTSGAFMRVQLGALSGGSWIFFNALDAVFFFGLCLIAGLAPRAGVRCTVRSRWKSGSA